MADLDKTDDLKLITQLRDQIGSFLDKTPRPVEPQKWSIWPNPGQSPQLPNQSQIQQRPDLSKVPQRPDLPQIQVLAQADMPQSPVIKPEQMVGNSQASDAQKQEVYKAIDQARKQGNRTISSQAFMQAINMSDQLRDGSLQAMSKVEFGLANISWGFSEVGFKWILEAGSNNPNLYDSQKNKSFLQRLGQAGIPSSAIDLLVSNGKQDPNWYLKDTAATKKLDAAMIGPAFVPPAMPTDGQKPNMPGGERDPLAPPTTLPEPLNPNIQQAAQAGPWMKEQFIKTLKSAGTEVNPQTAFNLYKQATDMADRSGDKTLQATARVEAGLSLIARGNVEAGFKWLLDAGSKVPSLYDNRVNQAFQKRLHDGRLTDAAIDMYLKNGQRDPNWHIKDPNDAASRLATVLKSPNTPLSQTPEIPYLPIPNPFPIQQNPNQFPIQAKPNPFPIQTKPNPFPIQTIPTPVPANQHIKPSPFGG